MKDKADAISQHKSNLTKYLPPPQTKIELTVESMPDQLYISHIIKREGKYDYLDAPHTLTSVNAVTLKKGPGHLYWRDSGGLWEVPIMIHNVLKPMPTLQIRYSGTIEQYNQRNEKRYVVHPRGWLTINRPETGPEKYRSVVRDASRSMVRCFISTRVKPGDMLQAAWDFDTGFKIQGDMQVYAVRDGMIQYKDFDGWNIVAFWNPGLEGEKLAGWMNNIRNEQY